VVDRNIRTNIAGRNILRAPALSSVDVSLSRTFKLGFIPLEGSQFQVRADFYNVFNRHQCAFTGADDANVLKPFFNQPQLNECGPGPGPQYNRTGRIELKFQF
jgi:hypothetical protein